MPLSASSTARTWHPADQPFLDGLSFKSLGARGLADVFTHLPAMLCAFFPRKIVQVRMYVCMYVYLSVCLSRLSVRLSVRPPVCLSVCLSVCIHISLCICVCILKRAYIMMSFTFRHVAILNATVVPILLSSLHALLSKP